MDDIKKVKVLFLDRDGTICFDGGAFGSEECEYEEVMQKQKVFDGVKEGLLRAKEKGYILIVISNQAGIAKGRFDEYNTHIINKKINAEIDNIIDGFYYCPHHTTGKNAKGIIRDNARYDLIFKCDCRKPKIGMFLQAENDLRNGMLQYIDEDIIENKVGYVKDRDSIFKRSVERAEIDKNNSYMVGDKWIDVVAGENYGVKGVMVMSGEGSVEYYEKKDKQKVLPQNYLKFESLTDFLKTL